MLRLPTALLRAKPTSNAVLANLLYTSQKFARWKNTQHILFPLTQLRNYQPSSSSSSSSSNNNNNNNNNSNNTNNNADAIDQFVASVAHETERLLHARLARLNKTHTDNGRIRIAVGMSGGIDSAVTAYLLKSQGFDVIGVHMRNWDESDESGESVCPETQDWLDVQQVCSRLQIQCLRVDFVKEYWNAVWAPTVDDYSRGWTPNPDLLCNRYVKFDAFLKYCTQKLNADFIATGHYARVMDDASGTARLVCGVDPNKDQSYFLAFVSSEALSRTLFPLGSLHKSQVRVIAQRTGEALSTVSSKRESMGVCFIGKKKKFSDFISDYMKDSTDKQAMSSQETRFFAPLHHNNTQKSKKSVQFHQKDVYMNPALYVDSKAGLNHLLTITIGQSAHLPGLPSKYFVYHKDIPNGSVFVCEGTDNPLLFSKRFYANKIHWITGSSPTNPQQQQLCYIKVRYRNAPVRARISTVRFSDIIAREQPEYISEYLRCWQMKDALSQDDEFLMVEVDEPVRAVTPQQVLVVYHSPATDTARAAESGEEIDIQSLECAGGGLIAIIGNKNIH